jgi:hypothetical protein
VEQALCELKSYLEVRPVYHRRPDRVINHVRLNFLAYWLSARLGENGAPEAKPKRCRASYGSCKPFAWARCGWARTPLAR